LKLKMKFIFNIYLTSGSALSSMTRYIFRDSNPF